MLALHGQRLATAGTADAERLARAEEQFELTILMPCLNEAETLATCIRKAQAFLARSGINGEILVADNGSTDGSPDIARNCGARLVCVPERGYGAALQHGIKCSAGRYVIMGDSDDSYDFSELDRFVQKLRAGFDLVMGNRFIGGIKSGAMPFLHRYLGNPALSLIGRLFYAADIGDFYCGLRGFRRAAILELGLKMPGMEFASEMVVRSALAGLRVAQVATTLSPDGRSRRPHLRTWRDGWRGLRFLLLFSPRWLFLYPGVAISIFGAVLTLLLLPGPIAISQHITLDLHSLMIGCLAMLVGAQAISFAVISRRYATTRGLLPPSHKLERFGQRIKLETILIASLLLLVSGVIGIVYCIFSWAALDFGTLRYGAVLRVLTLSSASVALAIQVAFTAFLAAILEIGG
jgi:glycosyltransferase involved in cell wall biosynthesis